MDTKRLLTAGLLLIALLLSLSACRTNNVGINLTVIVAVPAGMSHGADATWSVQVTNGAAPYTVEWVFGAGADPSTVDSPAGPSPITTTVEMQADPGPETYTFAITVTDANGLSTVEAGQYTVDGPTNVAPVIDEVLTVFDTTSYLLTVVASDADGDALTASVTVPTGWSVDGNDKAMSQADVTATFQFTPDDLFAPINFATTITVADGTGEDTFEIADTVVVALALTDDTLLAIPLASSAATGEGVLVVVATGALPNPFQYLNGVGITVPDDATYEGGTFNAGAPGGAAGDLDGAWELMNPPGGFLLPPDNFILPTDLGGGVQRWDFNLTPIGGSDTPNMEGALFNFSFTFASAGAKQLGFQEFLGVDRTYYTAADTVIQHWGDITNDHAGIPNTVTVE